MSPGLFLTTFSFYIISVILAMILSFLYKYISNRVLVTAGVFHFLILIFWIIFKIFFTNQPDVANHLFISFFCSGLIISGLIIRKKVNKILKYYFLIFLASVILFVISPSRLIGFIGTGSIHAINPERIHIIENYFILEQFSVNNIYSGKYPYKVIKEMGMYHQTIIRDIDLTFKPESVIVEEYIKDSLIKINAHSNSSPKLDTTLLIQLNLQGSKSIIQKR